MSLTEVIAPHLPYLRRFARALAGTQSAGDQYALQALETIVEAPHEFSVERDVRVALYRQLWKVWQSVNLRGASGVESGRDMPRQRLDAMSSPAMTAFLLSSVEGFSTEQVAATLGVEVSEAEALIAKAGEEIASQLKSDVLIIEDEPLIAIDLQSLVEGLGHTVVDVARTHGEAIKAVSRHRPSLILADVQLADGSSGLDAVNEILDSFEVPVIFITAFPERLLTGEKPEPAFLITKPFRVDHVKAIISQALFFDQSSPGRRAAS